MGDIGSQGVDRDDAIGVQVLLLNLFDFRIAHRDAAQVLFDLA